MAFLRAEYSKLVWFVVAVAVLLAYQGWQRWCGKNQRLDWALLCRGRFVLCAGWFYRNESGHQGQCPHCSRRPHESRFRVDRRFPRRLGDGHGRGGPRCAGAFQFVFRLSRPRLGDHKSDHGDHGLLLWRVLDCAFRPCGRRHLHEGRRRGRGSRGQGGSGHPGGSSAQPRHHRRQRGRQRGRRRRHGRGSVRKLRGLDDQRDGTRRGADGVAGI